MHDPQPELRAIFCAALGRGSPPERACYLDEALTRLAQEDAVCAELVKLRFFAGLTLEEAAAALGIARRTVDRYWAFARSWLYDALRQQAESAPE